MSCRCLASCPGPISFVRAREEVFDRVTQGDGFFIIQTPYGLPGAKKKQLFLERKQGAMVYLAASFHLEHNTPQKALSPC